MDTSEFAFAFKEMIAALFTGGSQDCRGKVIKKLCQRGNT
jgi:hypothetical protein